MSFLAEKLKQAYENYHRKEKMKIHLKHLDFMLSKQQDEIDRLAKIMEKEQADVERLESKNSFSESLRAIFIEVLEDKETQLEVERQEFLQAYLQWEAAIKEMKLLHYEKEVLEEQYKKIKYSKRSLNKLLRDRENYLRKTNSKTAKGIFAVDQRKNELTNRISEIEEAVVAGDILSDSFRTLEKELQQIKHWGDFGMGGKGRYSSYKKKKYIERNREDLHRINHEVLSYATELKDISVHLDVHFSQFVKSFEGFLTEFYDNLITDWVIRRKLNHTIGGVATLVDKITRINASLESEKGRSERELKTLDGEIDQLILKEV